MPAPAYMEFYIKAIAYCERQTACLSDAQLRAIPAQHPELAQWTQQADTAALAGDLRACQANLRQWMKGWKAAAAEAVALTQATLEFPD